MGRQKILLKSSFLKRMSEIAEFHCSCERQQLSVLI
jgi:hypothetical protein